MTQAAPRNAFDVIADVLDPLAGRLVLDIGAGSGGLAAPLTRAGAGWVGVDPQEVPKPLAPVVRAGAEALPFSDGAFDAALFVNSLHHVPEALMGAALDEAARVTRAGAPIVVIEPIASGALSEVLAVIDDETRIRAAAEAAVQAAVSEGRLVETRAYCYDRLEFTPDFNSFVHRVVSIEPGRKALAEARALELEATFMGRAAPHPRGFALSQPMQVHVLRKP
ncbi:class I SAM-dependent methyltransferase [Phaeovulum vinaykumarii]|uniref:Pimeloyl-CoA biosynthesis protein BioC n=1 Tax=Phaeovulum vinaykumarii TaxID=407234 RepID=A0A1N7MKE8_9RHOB|nr:class I SAM-dependent methyltransferase [Phaeovulum vinaykumarii]SIS86644.1 pimeloyl-CoA biosynthesis protein BioC [Phaeovulum vinaykumarii]SOC13475.1 pimeloyl-CoA biosynthesis protein BioC [Phaeovulum vinaykumarii]